MYKTRKRGRHLDYDIYADLEKIKNAFADTASDVRGRTGQFINDSYENAKDKAFDLQGSVVHFTKAQPLKTLGWTLLAGIVIGILLRRK